MLHISDLHFGRIHPPAIESLEQFLLKQDKKIDLIIMTGDWTQRARYSQFKAAAQFIEKVGIPVLSIPGNHDIPLYNFFMRWLAPFFQYNLHIAPKTRSLFLHKDLVVVGVSTVHPKRAVEGTLSSRDVERVHEAFQKAGPNAIRVLACHHPILETEGHTEVRPHKRVTELLALKPDIILSGHSHLNRVEKFPDPTGHPILHISAGSALSTRLRGEANSFHTLEFSNQQLKIETYFLSDTGFLTKEAPLGQTTPQQIFPFHKSF